MVYGVTVTLLILVQSFKVRILVDQQKAQQKCWAFLLESIKKPLCRGLCYLDFKSNYGSSSVINQIFTNAAIEEMC